MDTADSIVAEYQLFYSFLTDNVSKTLKEDVILISFINYFSHYTYSEIIDFWLLEICNLKNVHTDEVMY